MGESEEPPPPSPPPSSRRLVQVVANKPSLRVESQGEVCLGFKREATVDSIADRIKAAANRIEPMAASSGGVPGLCSKSEDLVELNRELDLWLKPIAKVKLTVELPQMKIPGQCISTWEVMEKLKRKARPHHFKTLKVIKSAIGFIRFEGELESKATQAVVANRLDKICLKLSGFAESLKVRCGLVKVGSTRHQWEAYFRDNPHMNEMKPGYRPDTIHVLNLPCKWFGGERPKANLLLKVFGAFGDIRRFHIPCLDEMRPEESLEQAGSGFKKFNFSESLHFDAFIMFRDYIGFVKTMDAFRGMKLVKKLDEVNRYLEYDLAIDFDKTKHLSDKAIKRRRLSRAYGIKSAQEMRNLKEETRKQRLRFEERVKQLNQRKAAAKRLLEVVFEGVAEKERKRRADEEAEKAEQKLKDRLLDEEVKLREKLIERRREFLRQQVKERGDGLKSVATASTLQRSPGALNNHSALYKNHKSSCKHYRPRSLIVRRDENK